jgi:hypothetical protein
MIVAWLLLHQLAKPCSACLKTPCFYATPVSSLNHYRKDNNLVIFADNRPVRRMHSRLLLIRGNAPTHSLSAKRVPRVRLRITILALWQPACTFANGD